MMNRYVSKTSIVPITLFLMMALSLGQAGCVSINIGGGEVERADGVKYTNPHEPFEDEDLPHVDEAWKNPGTGNSISFITDCGTSHDPSLQTVRSGVLSGLSNVKITNEEEGRYNNRASLRSQAKGSVDGIESQFDLMIFKKNGCIYILTYVGIPGSYEKDQPAFEQFLQGFRAP